MYSHNKFRQAVDFCYSTGFQCCYLVEDGKLVKRKVRLQEGPGEIQPSLYNLPIILRSTGWVSNQSETKFRQNGVPFQIDGVLICKPQNGVPTGRRTTLE